MLNVCFWEVLVGDRENQNIYILDLETFIDNGILIRRVRTGPHIHNDRKRLYFKEFEIDIERGVGLDGIVNTDINPEGSLGKNPQAFLTWSDDGGRTFSNEYWASLGAIGEYKTRIHWHRLVCLVTEFPISVYRSCKNCSR